MPRLRRAAATAGLAAMLAVSPALATAAPGGRDGSDLVAAERALGRAEARLARAERASNRLTRRADAAEVRADSERRSLGNLARSAYALGPADLLSLAAIFDAPDPADVMRRAAVARLVAEHQDEEWARALTALARAQRLRARSEAVLARASQDVQSAEQAVQAIHRRKIAATLSGGGAALSRLCDRIGGNAMLCRKPPWSEAHLTLDAIVIERYVRARWPQIRLVGGWRPSDPYPDHPSGRAVDIMMPDAGATAGDVQLGNGIAAYFQEHAREFGIEYMIWRQQIWTSGSALGEWSAMADRGSPTANHMDHVHITVSTGTSGTAALDAFTRAAARR